MDGFVSFFRQHGTKVLGWIIQALGVLSAADPELIIALGGERAPGVIVLILGMLTTLRGHTNTAKIKDEIRIEEKAKEVVKVEKAVDKMMAGTEGMIQKE